MWTLKGVLIVCVLIVLSTMLKSGRHTNLQIKCSNDGLYHVDYI